MRYAILHATIVGPIWQPNFICSKQVRAKIVRSDEVTDVSYPSLREALLQVLRDGDFQACGLAPGSWLEVVEETAAPGHTLKRRTRIHDLAFASWATSDVRAKDDWLNQLEKDDNV